MIGYSGKDRAIRDSRGFTLIEMLVAVFIVGLALTVFLQLLSSSMKLSHKSRQRLDNACYADEVFSHLLSQDIREDSFNWSGESARGRWVLTLNAVEISTLTIRDLDELNIVLPADLYQFTLTLYRGDERVVFSLESLRQYPLDHFTEDFKQQYVQPRIDQEGL